MKEKYFGFVLGREGQLSKAELLSFYKARNKEIKIRFESKGIIILETDFVPEIKKLGGTIKIFQLLGKDIPKSTLEKFIFENVEINQNEKRVNFGISGYGKIQNNLIYSLGKKIKNQLIEDGQKARFVTSKFNDLSSVIVHENKLLERGFEVILIESGNTFFVGQTIEVQDYKAYSKRDFGRLARDDRSGMLPPKLAQILINLGGQNTEKVLYDPFCGSGTVVQEAILMDYKKIYGSDISPKAVEDTKKNIEWLFCYFTEGKSNKDAQIDIFSSDVLKPSKNIKADLIVGEGFLGEPTRRNVAQAKNDANSLAEFYLKALTQLSRMLEKDGTIVLALPYFIIGKEKVFLPILDKLSLTSLHQKPLSFVETSKRNTLLYARQDSFVGREIFILEKL